MLLGRAPLGALVSLLVLGAGSAAYAHSVVSPAALRKGPGAKWPVVAEVPAGASINVINCGPGWKTDWCHIQYGSAHGYVVASTLAPSGHDVIVAPVVTTDLANVRQGPGANWRVLGTIPPGEAVDSAGCINGWWTGWCRVRYGGLHGFVRAALLTRHDALFTP